ncbi:MAG: AraC family transcriptional regulator [Gemmatimonadetes bacterium]|nr:AraC family transcriptional regulator [Gemmatimonadota bacterium]
MSTAALFGTSQTDLARIARSLSQAGFALVHCRSWSALIREADRTVAAVIVAPWLGCDVSLADVRTLTERCPWYPLVLVTEPEPSNLRLLVRVIVSDVLFLRSEERRLAQTIRSAQVDGFFCRAAELIRRSQSLAPVLRSALLYALEQAPAPLPVDSEELIAPARSIRALADRLHTSEDHLSHAAKEHGLSLRAFLDWCIALRALQLRIRAGAGWETIAWRLGYRSVSGLSEHLKHTLGLRPSHLGHGQIQRWFSEFESRFLAAAFAARARNL